MFSIAKTVKKGFRKTVAASLLCLNLFGCYRPVYLGSQGLPSLSISQIEGDQDGFFTTELVKGISDSGLYHLTLRNADFLLQVKLLSPEEQVVGFRYDRKHLSGKLEKNLMNSENRLSMGVEVSLLSSASGEVVTGPLPIKADADYDYVNINSLRELSFISPSGKRKKVVVFSLGQLDSVEAGSKHASEAACRYLAEKIVHWLQLHYITSHRENSADIN